MKTRVLFHTWILVTGEQGMWRPLVRWVYLPCIPRAGDEVCLGKLVKYGGRVVVSSVCFREDGLVVAEIEGEEFESGQDKAIEASAEYYVNEMGFVDGYPDDIDFGSAEFGTMGAMDQTTSLLTLSELAAALRIPEGWLRDEAHAGRLPHLRIGKRCRFSLAAVEAVLVARAASAGLNVPGAE